MDSETLQRLLSRDETDTIEFKSRINIYDSTGKISNRTRDEFVKDILALANGNATTIKDTKYLIVGVDDKFDSDGKRPIYGVTEKLPTAGDIHKIVNAVCYPPIVGVKCEFVEVDNKSLYVIAIPPTPNLYETTRQLDTPKKKYDEHIVFIRHDENIKIAAAREREAILKLKQLYYSEIRNAPPVTFGAILGGIIAFVSWQVGATASKKVSEKISTERQLRANRIATGLIGIILGAMWGWNFREFKGIRYEWPYFSRWQQIFLASIGIAGGLGVTGALYKLRNWLKVRLPSTDMQNK